jgi:NAD(P)-dependent dehydrogenase (short-subunit alcohol dehydrogenase family)
MDPMSFDGRVAVVTGAGGGLGRQHALELARRGASVVVNDLGGAIDGSGGSAGPAADVVAEIEAAGGTATADTNSVATSDGGAAIIQTAMDAFGRIDVVINNAGILRDKSFAKLDDELVDAVIAVHLKGAFNVTRPAWSHMREQGYGRIVSTASNAGLLGNFGQANYGAAKMGLVGLTNVLAIEGEKYNIRANVIAPVATTRMTEEVFQDRVKEMMDPAKVTPAVVYLAHEDCTISGEVLSAAGGRIARFFVGLTQGWVPDGELTVEGVRDHLDEIRDESDYLVLGSAFEEIIAASKKLSPS